MSSYLRSLIADVDEGDPDAGRRSVKDLPRWLKGVQSDRPVSFDTSQSYEMRGMDWRAERERNKNRKCYECGAFGHIAKECTKRKGKKTSGFQFKSTDWQCPSCGNINWDWRQHCNKCNLKKPDDTADEKRTGKAGGYNEIDEETRARMAAKKGLRKTTKKQEEKKASNPYIYIQGIVPEAKLEQIVKHFKQVGAIRKRRGEPHIVMFADDDGNVRGDAILEYDKSSYAPYSLEWFDNKPFLSVKIKVCLATEEQLKLLETDIHVDHSAREKEEMAALEAEIFGYKRQQTRGRGAGRGRGRTRGRGRAHTSEKERSRSKEKRSRRSRSRSKDRRRRRSRSKER